ncbi:hypothetical protein U9M48_035104 [Paspalum notatum var. saurae]|uniref:Embryonic flower 1-like protein n=1 Tax=Paspalum notatum var. saurae TaxID=547442 RepID=A0AAQ3UAF3_PASNO
MEAATLASKTGAVEEPSHLCNFAHPVDRPADQQECNHFSLRTHLMIYLCIHLLMLYTFVRGHVALLQKKDPKLCSFQIFSDQQQYDENHNSSPLSVAKYHRWNCTKCLDRVKTSGHRTKSEINSLQKYETDGCSISIVRTLRNGVDSRRLFSSTTELSKGNDAEECGSLFGNKAFSALNVPATSAEENVQDAFNEKSVPTTKCMTELGEFLSSTSGHRTTSETNSMQHSQECGSPFGKKAISEANVPATLAEENVQDVFIEKNVPATDFQVSPNNLDVSANILNDVSMDVRALPDVPQMISSLEANDTHSPRSPKPCVMPNEEENRTTQDVPNNYPNESTPKPIFRHKDSKHMSGHKSNLIHKQGPCQASLRRNVRSDSKKKDNKSTDLTDIPDTKFYQRKPKKIRLLSELVDTDQKGDSKDAIEVYYENTVGINESGKSRMSLEVGKDDDTHSNQKVGEIQSSNVKNKAKHTRVDNGDDGSPLIDRLMKTHKKVRTEKKDSGHMYLGFSAVSNYNLDMVASNEMHHDFLPSVGDLDQENVPSTIIADHGNEKAQNDNTEQNMLEENDMCKNSENLEQRFSSNENSMILLKRKVLPTAIAHGENTEYTSIKRDMLRADDSPQMESKGTVHICQTKDAPIDTSTVLDSNFQKLLASDGSCITNSKVFQCTPPKLNIPDILERAQEPQTHLNREEEVTIAFVSPTFLHHQHSAEVPAQSRSNKGEKKLMCDSFKTASRNSPTSTYGFQFRNIPQEVDSIPIHMYGASSNYVTDQPGFAAVDHCTNEVVNQVQLRSVPSTSITMEAGRLGDQRIAGQSGLYRREPMTSNYQRADRQQMEFQKQTLGPQYVQHDQFNASPNTSYGGHLIEKDSLTLQDLSQHQVQQNVHRPLRPHPRFGVFGPFLQKDIAKWSEQNVHRPLRPHPRFGVFGPFLQKDIAKWSGNCGTQSAYKLGESKGTSSFAINRKGNHETLNSGMFSTGCNDLQLGSVSSVDPELNSTSYGNHQIEKAPLTLQDLSGHQIQQNLHKPLSPHPRVGVFGPLLQQDIDNWSANYGTQSEYRLGVSTSSDMNRK